MLSLLSPALFFSSPFKKIPNLVFKSTIEIKTCCYGHNFEIEYNHILPAHFEFRILECLLIPFPDLRSDSSGTSGGRCYIEQKLKQIPPLGLISICMFISRWSLLRLAPCCLVRWLCVAVLVNYLQIEIISRGVREENIMRCWLNYSSEIKTHNRRTVNPSTHHVQEPLSLLCIWSFCVLY